MIEEMTQRVPVVFRRSDMRFSADLIATGFGLVVALSLAGRDNA
jgi:hypothetical protein